MLPSERAGERTGKEKANRDGSLVLGCSGRGAGIGGQRKPETALCYRRGDKANECVLYI